jgi:hypothetical protein
MSFGCKFDSPFSLENKYCGALHLDVGSLLWRVTNIKGALHLLILLLIQHKL